MKAILTRLDDDGKQTLGHLMLFKGLEKVFECKTLELPWKANETNVSCVPKGVYKVSYIAQCSKSKIHSYSSRKL